MQRLMYLLVLVFVFGCSTPAASNMAGSIFAELDRQIEARDTASHVWTENGYQFRCRLTNSSDKIVFLQVWEGEEIIYAEIFFPHTESYVWLYNGRYMFQWKRAELTEVKDWLFRGWRLTGKAAFIYNKTLDAWETTNEDFKNVH